MNSFLFFFFCFLGLKFVTCSEFEVGDEDGWVVPKANNAQMYNQWASKNRFKVGDSVHFKYMKDSVMVVTEEEYEKCKSSRPIYFSNNGDTDFKLDGPGFFYFISGVAGHCERGQKMIIKVLDIESSSSPPPQHSIPDDSPPAHKSNAAMLVPSLTKPNALLFLMVVITFSAFFSA